MNSVGEPHGAVQEFLLGMYALNECFSGWTSFEDVDTSFALYLCVWRWSVHEKVLSIETCCLSDGNVLRKSLLKISNRLGKMSENCRGDFSLTLCMCVVFCVCNYTSFASLLCIWTVCALREEFCVLKHVAGQMGTSYGPSRTDVLRRSQHTDDDVAEAERRHDEQHSTVPADASEPHHR